MRPARLALLAALLASTSSAVWADGYSHSIGGAGGGGTPGGSSGQVQVNNSGAFAGVTISGDGTISGSGVMAVTKTGGVSFGALATVTPGAGIATALGVAIGSAGAPVVLGGAGGTPASINLSNATALPAAALPALTGDITTSAGAAATTLATVNVNTGSFGSSTAIPSFTVNAKGLLTAAGTNAVIAPAGTLTGATLAANVLASSLTSVGVLTGGSAGAGFTVALSTATVTGTLAAGRLPALTGDATTSAGSAATTVGAIGGKAITLGAAFTTTGAGAATFALGASTQTYTFPSATATLAQLGANTFTGAQTFPASGIILTGSSTGVTTFASANAGASNFTVTVPAATDTLVTLGATQTLTNKTWQGSPIAIAYGGWGASSLPGSNGAVFYNNSGAPGALGLGTMTTVYHGNASGVGSFGAVNLATDVTGTLPTVINAQTGTSYTIAASDQGKLVTTANAATIAVTLPQATGSFTTGFTFAIQNKGAGTAIITPATSTINGASALNLYANQGALVVSDGTNWQVTSGGQGLSGRFIAATGASPGFAFNNNGNLNNGFLYDPNTDNSYMAVYLNNGIHNAIAVNGYRLNDTDCLQWTGSHNSFQAASIDLSLCRQSSGLFSANGGFEAKGTAPVLTTGSCSGSSAVGGATAGTFTAAVCTAGTYILSGLPAAANGYSCDAYDRTTPTDLLQQTASTTTAVTFAATTAASDAVQFKCLAY